MKKLLLSFILITLPLMASAYDALIDGVFYDFDASTKTAAVTCEGRVIWDDGIYLEGNNTSSGDVIIPSALSYNGVTYQVTSIKGSAFRGCKNLTSISIPNSVTSIGKYAFSRCNGLTSVYIPDLATWCNLKFEDSSANPFVYAEHLYLNGEEVKDFVIPNSVTSIGDYVFYGCSSLTSITIPNSVKTIGTYAFGHCRSLTSITIPNSVINVGNCAFMNCSGLTSITISNNVKSLGSSAFSNCSSLTSITIPSSVTSIGDYAFYDCSSLTSINIPNGVTSIEDGTFHNCCNLTSISIPDGVTSIKSTRSSGAFWNCSSLKSIIIPKSVTSIGVKAFYRCSSLTSIKVELGNSVYDSREYCNAIIETNSNSLILGSANTKIPTGITSIGDNAFNGCSGLASITIPQGVTRIGNNAFNGCSGLTSVTIPSSVTSIEVATFDGCSGLTSVTIPSSVTSIGLSAFYGCSSLTSVSIPSSVTSIGDQVFNRCSSLTSITIDKSVPIDIYSNVFTSRSLATLYVPKGSFDAYKAADYWKEFKEIKEFVRDDVATYAIENEEKTLTVNAVAEPTEEKVDLPASVLVDDTAYPVTVIAPCAFESNTVIKQVSIPETIEEIGNAAFSGCSELNTITCHAEEPIALGSAVASARTRAAGDESTPNVFNGVNKVTCLLYVPVASVSKYKATDGWKDFKYIVGIGSGFIIGDINGDKELDDKDVHALINHVMGNPQEGTFDKDMADVNQDGHVDVNDVVFLVKLLGQK